MTRFYCGGGGTCQQSLAAGSYFLKLDDPGFEQLIPVTVAAGVAAAVIPPVGVAAFQWRGANTVWMDIVDSAQKFKLGRVYCAAGVTCRYDLAAGNYFLKLEDPGFEQMIPITVVAGSSTDVKPAVGIVAFQWSGSNTVWMDIVDSTQKFKLGRVYCAAATTCKYDLGAGNHFLKVEDPGFEQLIPVAVSAGGTTETKPPVGILSFQWNGPNTVWMDIVDSAQKFKLGRVYCGSGATCKYDLAAGNYFLKIEDARFNQLAPVNVIAGQTSRVAF